MLLNLLAEAKHAQDMDFRCKGLSLNKKAPLAGSPLPTCKSSCGCIISIINDSAPIAVSLIRLSLLVRLKSYTSFRSFGGSPLCSFWVTVLMVWPMVSLRNWMLWCDAVNKYAIGCRGFSCACHWILIGRRCGVYFRGPS